MKGRKVVTVAATQAGRNNFDLGLVVLWRPDNAVLDFEVIGTVEDGSVVGRESDRGHWDWLEGRMVFGKGTFERTLKD